MNRSMFHWILVAVINLSGMACLAEDVNQSRNMPLVEELKQFYKTPSRSDFSGPQPQVLRPPELEAIHLTEKYREAWEQFLIDETEDDSDEKSLRWLRITRALAKISSPRSIDSLEQAFSNLSKSGVPHKRVVSQQEDILLILTCIPTKESFATIFKLLDRVDSTYPEADQAKTSDGYDLREKVLMAINQPNNPGKSSGQLQRLERANMWKSIAQDYNKTGLTVKNRELLNKVENRNDTK